MPSAAYEALRNQALHMNSQQIGLPASPDPSTPWAVVMDWGMGEANATVTVLAIFDGTASIYFSTGGGSIGGGQSHESIRAAAQRAVIIASEVQPQVRKVTSYPLPKSGEVAFYLLSDAGVFSASATQADLSAHRHPLSKLGSAMQDIITQYRLTQAKQ